jgi:hypothetical protein
MYVCMYVSTTQHIVLHSFASPAAAAAPLHAQSENETKSKAHDKAWSIHTHSVERVTRQLPVPMANAASSSETGAVQPWAPPPPHRKTSFADVTALGPAYVTLVSDVCAESFMVTAMPDSKRSPSSSVPPRNNNPVDGRTTHQHMSNDPNEKQTGMRDVDAAEAHGALGRRSSRTRTRPSSSVVDDGSSGVELGEQTTATATRRRRAFRASDASKSKLSESAQAAATLPDSRDVDPFESAKAREAEALAVAVNGSLAVLALFSRIGRACWHLSEFRCVEALRELERLPPAQYGTAWVLSQVGRAKFELGNYDAGAQAFALMCGRDPGRTSGLEFYSTNLWHLKKVRLFVSLCFTC